MAGRDGIAVGISHRPQNTTVNAQPKGVHVTSDPDQFDRQLSQNSTGEGTEPKGHIGRPPPSVPTRGTNEVHEKRDPPRPPREQIPNLMKALCRSGTVVEALTLNWSTLIALAATSDAEATALWQYLGAHSKTINTGLYGRAGQSFRETVFDEDAREAYADLAERSPTVVLGIFREIIAMCNSTSSGTELYKNLRAIVRDLMGPDSIEEPSPEPGFIGLIELFDNTLVINGGQKDRSKATAINAADDESDP